jgi:DNA-binding transcriptional MerR regulator
MLRIGVFARLSQVTVKALRFYDEIGLLKPTYVDRVTGYRYYAPQLLSRLNKIQVFKEIGFSLAEISSMLQTDLSDEQVHSLLQSKRVELSQQIALAQVQLAQVDAWLQQLPAPVKRVESPIMLKQTDPQMVASLRATIDTYEEAYELFDELQHYLGRYQRTGQRATIWHACGKRSSQIDCEALILLNQRVPESKWVRVYELPTSTAASVVHQGSDDTIEESYRAVRHWVKAQGYTLVGPNREVYWPEAHAQAGTADLTEIQFPISIARKAGTADN